MILNPDSKSPVDASFLLEDGVFSKSSIGMTKQELSRLYSKAKQLYDAGKFDEARTLFSTLVLLDPQVPAFLYGLASTLLMMKDYDNAVEVFLEYAGIMQEDPLPYFFAAECYEKKQDTVSTMIALQTVINRAGDRPQYKEIKNRAILVLDALKAAAKERDNVPR